ncbi:MAG TPA: ABC transporter ATP-binding protein [Clostridiales bacterium]|jgi:ATP-binding cassette subfamily B protein|nr:ABC transporter ATP-binding protein [Clostridiales bacterium]
MKSNKNGKAARPTLPRLIEYIKPHSGWLALSMVCAAASVIFTLFIPVLTGDIIDLCIGEGKVELSAFPPMLIKLGVCVLAAVSAGLLSSYFNNRITFRCARELRLKAFARITGAPLSLLDSAPSGELINRVTGDIDYVSDGLLHAFTQLFTGVAAICGTLVFMLRASARASLPVILLTPLSIAVAAVIARGSYKYFSRQTATQADMAGYLDEYVGRAGLVKAFGREKAACDGFDKINSELYECGYMAQVYSALVNPSTRLVNNFVFAAVGVTGALIACRGGLTVGQITMFLAYASQYAKPFNEISGIAAQLTAALASADRVFKLIDTPFEDADDPKEPLEAAVAEKIGEVSLENVSFSYSPDKKLIEELNLQAKPGQRIAIVGPTGCGKTTIINLLMRFYDIRGGKIYADGRDAYSIHRGELRQRYAMVLQDTWLMRGTVAENIAYGAKGEVSRAEIEQAAERAMASPFIRQLKNGYDTVIDDGDTLSGGQKQLICIARVMLAAARNHGNGTAESMLILDEATSNIDTRTELLVQQAFSDLMRGRTSFVVAHRLSTIKSSDIILVMDSGKVVEQGSHEQLLAKNGFYAALWKAMTENS